MINGTNMKTAAVGSGAGVVLLLHVAKPSPGKSIPPPATEEEKELLASPPRPPVPQVLGLDTAPDETARNRRRSELPRALEAGGLSLE